MIIPENHKSFCHVSHESFYPTQCEQEIKYVTFACKLDILVVLLFNFVGLNKEKDTFNF